MIGRMGGVGKEEETGRESMDRSRVGRGSRKEVGKQEIKENKEMSG